MATPAFKKLAAFTDLHVGHKNNSQQFNQDCWDYIQWYVKTAQDFGAETCVFSGDFFHNRSTINVASMNVALDIMEYVAKSFEKVYFLVGNHDMYYRDDRRVHSLVLSRNIENVVLVDQPLTLGDTTFLPWLIGDEWKAVEKLKSRYIFGHFELPGYWMNAMVQMPDHDGLKDSHFKHAEYVFTGHFHKRQNTGKVWYIGNCFPHDFADAQDDERGCLLLENGGTPQLVNWADCPKYRTFKLSDLLQDPERLIPPKSYVRVTIDLDISYEESGFLKQTFLDLGAREVELRAAALEMAEIAGPVTAGAIETVDQVVERGLRSVESATLDPAFLVDIYKSLPSTR